MNSLQLVFNHSQYGEVRVLGTSEDPRFIAKDVCEALGISQYRKAVLRLDDDERELLIVHTLGGMQRALAVTESGLYHLVFTSQKPEAKAFRKWVTSEVLPSIRKTGGYSMPQWMADEALLQAEKTFKKSQRMVDEFLADSKSYKSMQSSEVR